MRHAWLGGTAPIPALALTVSFPSGVGRLIAPPGCGHLCATSALSASFVDHADIANQSPTITKQTTYSPHP
jgi:hypothetical protein